MKCPFVHVDKALKQVDDQQIICGFAYFVEMVTFALDSWKFDIVWLQLLLSIGRKVARHPASFQRGLKFRQMTSARFGKGEFQAQKH